MLLLLLRGRFNPPPLDGVVLPPPLVTLWHWAASLLGTPAARGVNPPSPRLTPWCCCDPWLPSGTSDLLLPRPLWGTAAARGVNPPPLVLLRGGLTPTGLTPWYCCDPW